MSATVPFWAEMVSKVGAPSIAAVSAFYVYLQYRRARRWKAEDLAASHLQKLQSDPVLVLTCQALDWGTGPLIIPEQYRPLFCRDQPGTAPAVMDHDPAVMKIALEPALRQATLDDPRGLVYRYSFIKLFDYLNNICRLVADGQLRAEDITDLHYWLNNLLDYPYAPRGTASEEVFQPALLAWGYDSVLALARRRTPPTSST